MQKEQRTEILCPFSGCELKFLYKCTLKKHIQATHLGTSILEEKTKNLAFDDFIEVVKGEYYKSKMTTLVKKPKGKSEIMVFENGDDPVKVVKCKPAKIFIGKVTNVLKKVRTEEEIEQVVSKKFVCEI